MRKIFVGIIGAVISLLLACCSWAGDQDLPMALEADGYKYIYKTIPVLHPSSKEIMYNTGKITVSKISDQQVVYEENLSLQPGHCSGFPSMSKLSFIVPIEKLAGGNAEKDRNLAVLCGSNSGRHQTIKVFFHAPGALKVATFDFGNTRPNIADVNSDGIYESHVYRRIVFDDLQRIGATPYLFIYELNVDSSAFGFVPKFGQGMKQSYFDYYQKINTASKPNITPNSIGPMLGALFSTKDEDVICREVHSLAEKGKQLGEIQKWSDRLSKAGYPYFDLNTCKGR